MNSMMKKNKIRLLVSIFLAVFLTANLYGGLAGRINSVINRKVNKKARFAVMVARAECGTVLYQLRSHEPMIPASNMKLVVSAAAVKYLGDDYNFKTLAGLLNNNLVIIGQGDPLLEDEITDEKYNRQSGWVHRQIIDRLKSMNINQIDNIIIDSTFFDNNLVHPNWPKDQLNRSYACEVSGLNYNGNCIKIHTKNYGGVVKVTAEPRTGYVTIIDKTRAKSSGSSAVGSYRNGTANKITVFGKCRKEAAFDVAIERPGAFFGYIMAEKLAENRIKVTGKLIEKYVKKNNSIKIFWVHQTPISEVLLRCNRDSYALAAESLVKTISAENTTGRINGEWPHGLTLIGRYLSSLGIDSDEYKLDDGRGLSRENRLSPNAIVKVLLDVYNSGSWEMFRSSLAVGGQSGTVDKYFNDSRYKGKIRGKTGYISKVRSFSGITETDKGKFIFSIMTEGGSSVVRKSINDIAKEIADGL